jgi:hypothetical protein
MTGPVLQQLADLRRSLTDVATECDAIIYAQPWNARRALQRLPGLLDQLLARADLMKQALMREEDRR